MQHHTTNTNQCNWLECNNFLIAKVPTQPKSISRKINQKHLKLTPIGELTQAKWTIGHANTIFTSIFISAWYRYLDHFLCTLAAASLWWRHEARSQHQGALLTFSILHNMSWEPGWYFWYFVDEFLWVRMVFDDILHKDFCSCLDGIWWEEK